MIQAVISGLVLGSIYALIAQGYYITYITTNTLNFGQGEFLMFGAMFGLALVGSGLSFWVAVPVVMALVAAMGLGLELVAIRPLRHFASISWVLSTVAVSIILKNTAMLVWGRNVMLFQSPFGDQVLRLGESVGIYPHEVFVIAISAAVMGLLFLFLRRSILGKALMAVAYNRDAAALMGINPRSMAMFAYALSSALAGLGGLLVGPITFTSFHMGAVLGLKAFAAAIVGGLENPVGILVGGLLIGLVEQVVALNYSGWKDASAFVLILAVLAIAPQGLLGKRLREKF